MWCEEAHHADEFVRVVRLGQRRLGAHRARHDISADNPADDHDRHAASGTSAIFRCEALAGESSAEVEIEDEHIRVEPEFVGDLKGLITTSRDPHRELLTQRGGERGEGVGIILDNEHTRTRLHYSRCYERTSDQPTPRSR